MRLYQKKTSTQVFACEYCETFKNSYSAIYGKNPVATSVPAGWHPELGGGGQAAAGYYSLGQGIWGKI